MGGSSSVRGDQTIYHTDNMCFDGTDRGSPMAVDGQLWIGATASNRADNGGHVRLGSITSPGGSITVGYSAPNITLEVAGGGSAIEQITVDNATVPGTNPVLPSGGNITITGGQVANANLANVIQTHSLAANSFAVTIQRADSAAAADTTQNGVAHFDSASFAVAATGFVTLSTTGAGKTITGDSGGALSPSSNNWNILGGPGVTTTGSGSTLTINSTVFTDTTATTMAVDNGYFATAAGTYNLPATAAQGELITIVCDTAGAVVVDAPALNFIRVGSSITAASGTATSNAIGDSLTLRYRASSLTWVATSVVGTWTLA